MSAKQWSAHSLFRDWGRPTGSPSRADWRAEEIGARVQKLLGLPPDRFLPEAHVSSRLSHWAAEQRPWVDLQTWSTSPSRAAGGRDSGRFDGAFSRTWRDRSIATLAIADRAVARRARHSSTLLSLDRHRRLPCWPDHQRTTPSGNPGTLEQFGVPRWPSCHRWNRSMSSLAQQWQRRIWALIRQLMNQGLP